MSYERFIREAEREAITGIKQSTWYRHIEEGLAPPPIKLGRFAAAYPRTELIALNSARAAGKTDDEIRQIVKRLVVQRAKAFDVFESTEAA